jgi:adenosylcobyric acid synthase
MLGDSHSDWSSDVCSSDLTYVHGLFGDDRQRAAWLARFSAGPANIIYEDLVERTLDTLAAHLATHLDLDRLLKLAR